MNDIRTKNILREINNLNDTAEGLCDQLPNGLDEIYKRIRRIARSCKDELSCCRCGAKNKALVENAFCSVCRFEAGDAK